VPEIDIAHRDCLAACFGRFDAARALSHFGRQAQVADRGQLTQYGRGVAKMVFWRGMGNAGFAGNGSQCQAWQSVAPQDAFGRFEQRRGQRTMVIRTASTGDSSAAGFAADRLGDYGLCHIGSGGREILREILAHLSECFQCKNMLTRF
jgi:hypothetical protein